MLFSLKYRITFIVFTLELLLLSFVLTQTLSFIDEQTQLDTNERHKVYIGLVKNMAQDALFAGEFEDLQTFVEKISIERDIVNVIATNQIDIVVADSKIKGIGSLFYYSTEKLKQNWVSESIDKLGTVYLQFSLEQNNRQLAAAKEMGFSIALTGIAIIAIVSLLFGSILTRRLNKLIFSIQQFQMNSNDVDIDTSGRDEVAALAKSFKYLRSEINKNVKKLRKERQTLEQRVLERTQELNDAKEQLIKSNEELRIQSITDRFTGLANRGFLEDSISKEIARSKREKIPFGVILIDIDNFKTINDSFGHDAGDKIITKVVRSIRSSIREIDLAGRWGGDEFLVVCPKIDESSISEVANRILVSIKNNTDKDIKHITASLGVTLYQPGDRQNQIVKRADLALYDAKKLGKNCVQTTH